MITDINQTSDLRYEVLAVLRAAQLPVFGDEGNPHLLDLPLSVSVARDEHNEPAAKVLFDAPINPTLYEVVGMTLGQRYRLRDDISDTHHLAIPGIVVQRKATK